MAKHLAEKTIWLGASKALRRASRYHLDLIEDHSFVQRGQKQQFLIRQTSISLGVSEEMMEAK